MEKKSNHQVNVVRIAEVLPHSNADKLEIIHIDGYQCVVGKGQFKPGSLAIYIQPDSVVPQTEPFRFIWAQYVEPSMADPAALGIVDGKVVYEVPERRRRITVRKFRGEWSEGLLMPISDFPELPLLFLEGDDMSDLLGITHYDPDKGVEGTKGNNISGPRRRYPRTLKGWFFFLLHKLGFRSAGRQLNEEVSFEMPVYDVDAFKRYKYVFDPGEEAVIVTEKIHGSNARYVFLDGKMYAGSHNFWKAPDSNCVWRKALQQNPDIEKWCRDHEGYALYGEVTPTQKGFNYGCKEGEVRFFVFDIRTPEGEWLSKKDSRYAWLATYAIERVPMLYIGTFDLDHINELVDGVSTVIGAEHVREGVVITPVTERRVPGLGRVILKIVSNAFLEKDGKASAAPAQV